MVMYYWLIVMLNHFMMMFNYNWFTVLRNRLIVLSKVFKLNRLLFNRYLNFNMVCWDSNSMWHRNILMEDGLFISWLSLINFSVLYIMINWSDMHWGLYLVMYHRSLNMVYNLMDEWLIMMRDIMSGSLLYRHCDRTFVRV